ncbi:unannotated protein [freshwater metagenome]|uniref:Unannotated protein n=1 Tax=freshwater metagenome TaxID=449393 RepID=A0A6J6GQW4_9ZZZZ
MPGGRIGVERQRVRCVAVELAVGRAGQPVVHHVARRAQQRRQHGPHVGAHGVQVDRQAAVGLEVGHEARIAGDRGAQRLRQGERRIERGRRRRHRHLQVRGRCSGHQLLERARVVRGDDRGAHGRHAAQHAFDLLRLGAHPTEVQLVVAATEEQHRAVAHHRPVAGAEHRLAVERGEASGRGVAVTEVPGGHARAADHQLADHAGRSLTVVGSDDAYPRTGNGQPDRDGVVAGTAGVRRGPHGGLRRAVLVHERRAGAQRVVAIHQPRGARLTGDGHHVGPAVDLGAALEQRGVQGGDHQRVRDRPAGHDREQRVGVVHLGLGGQHQFAAVHQRPEEPGHAAVEGEAGEQQERPRGTVVHTGPRGGAPCQAPVVDLHAAWRAGRAGREDHVRRRVCVDGRVHVDTATVGRFARVVTEVTDDEVAVREPLARCRDDRRCGVRELGDRASPGRRVTGVHRHVRRTGAQHGDDRGDEVDRARELDQHPVGGPHTGRGEPAREPRRTPVELGPRDRHLAARHRRRVGPFRHVRPDRVGDQHDVGRRTGAQRGRAVRRQGNLADRCGRRGQQRVQHRVEVVEQPGRVGLGHHRTAELHREVDALVVHLDEERGIGDRGAVEQHLVRDAVPGEAARPQLAERQQHVDRRCG